MTHRRSIPLVIVAVGFFISLLILLAPDALAQAGPLYPGCSGIDCQFCHLMSLADRIVRYLILIAVPIVALLFSYAGFLYMSSQGSEEKIGKAKTIFKDVLFGFIIALLGFVIVDTVIKTLGNGFFSGPSWNEIQCVSNRPLGGPGLGFTNAQTNNAVSPEGILYESNPSQPATLSTTCADCMTLSSNVPGYNRLESCATQIGGVCQVSAQIQPNIVALAGDLQTAGIGWRVTEAWPPTVTHQAACHQNGTCIDASFVGTQATPQNVAEFISIASQNNLRAQYEVATQSQANTLRAQAQASGVTLAPADVLVVSGINGSHFSVYKR